MMCGMRVNLICDKVFFVYGNVKFASVRPGRPRLRPHGPNTAEINLLKGGESRLPAFPVAPGVRHIFFPNTLTAGFLGAILLLFNTNHYTGLL